MGNSATTGSSSPALVGKNHDPEFVWKIHGFPDLVKRGVRTIRSAPFYSSNYKWYLRVCAYHKNAFAIAPYLAVSLGLSLASVELEPDYMMEVVFELSMYNHSDGMYRGCTASYNFHGLHTKSDVECLIPLYRLLKSSDFLVDDCCVVGAEILKINFSSSKNNDGVMVQKKATTVQNLFIQDDRFSRGTFDLNITNFLELKPMDCICSSTVEFDGHKWYFRVYPHGDRYSTNCLSFYLCMDGSDELSHATGRAVELSLSVVDQKHGKHFTTRIPGLAVFAGKSRWGLPDFIPLGKLRDPSRGYLVGSSCVLRVEITILGSSNYV